jgi:hypothetical protein
MISSITKKVLPINLLRKSSIKTNRINLKKEFHSGGGKILAKAENKMVSALIR